MLKSRKTVPRIFTNSKGQDRLLILPNEESDATSATAKGRPIGPEYYDATVKLDFMRRHGITTSVLSLGNPWLDFIEDPLEAAKLAEELNSDLQEICMAQPHGVFWGFGVLPTSSPKHCVKELERISKLDKMRGAIIGTHGCGKGLDDPEWLCVFEAAARLNLMLFLHPHYGIPNEVYGSNADNGHVMPLALGFPFETTISVTRMILAGVFDKVQGIRLLLAHSGGCIPFLAGRLDSCVQHDPQVALRLKHTPSYYLKQLYYDAVNYHEHGLKNVESLVGRERVLFGTDNPFFPPLNEEETTWESVESNLRAIKEVFGSAKGSDDSDILFGNAKRILNI